jgi:peptide/nickel transport system substrate-binding protein
MSASESSGTRARARFNRRRFLAGAAIGGATLGLAACSGNAAAPAPSGAGVATAGAATAQPAAGTSPSPTVAVTAQPKLGGVLRFPGTDVAHFDIHQTSTSVLHSIYAINLSKLIQFKVGADVVQPGLIPVPDLAESWTQPDDVTYLFKMRSGAKWQNIPPVNGREVVADDVVYSFNRQVALKVNAGLLAGVDRFEAPDKSTVRITLKRPDADFLVSLASGPCRIVAHENVEAKGDLKELPVIGSGPWILDPAETKIGVGYFLRRNPDYYVKGFPYLDGLRFTILLDAATTQAAFRSRALDVYSIVSDQQTLDGIRKAVPDASVTRIPNLATAELGMKVDSGPTQDVRVRRAVSKAINRQQIIDTIYGGAGWYNPGFALPSADWGLSQDELKRLYQPDPNGARALLKEAGLDRLEVRAPVTDVGNGQYVTVAELVKAQLEAGGIFVTLDVMPHQQWVEVVGTRGTYDLYIGTSGSFLSTTANGDLFTRYRSNGPRNTMKLADPALDAMIDRQAVLVRDPAGRKKILQDIQRYLIDNPVLLMIGATVTDYLAQPYVKDYYPGVNGNVGEQYAPIWLDK